MSKILLLGMMGAGKTASGGADRQPGWPYLDNDEVVEQLTGLPTRELLERRGKGALRTAESQAWDRLANQGPGVAGWVGGVVETAEDLAALRGTGRVRRLPAHARRRAGGTRGRRRLHGHGCNPTRTRCYES